MPSGRVSQYDECMVAADIQLTSHVLCAKVGDILTMQEANRIRTPPEKAGDDALSEALILSHPRRLTRTSSAYKRRYYIASRVSIRRFGSIVL